MPGWSHLSPRCFWFCLRPQSRPPALDGGLRGGAWFANRPSHGARQPTVGAAIGDGAAALFLGGWAKWVTPEDEVENC